MPYIPTREEYFKRLAALENERARQYAKEMNQKDPTKVVLNRSEYSGIYYDSETGIRFRPGESVTVGKSHADRLLKLRRGKLFSPAD